MIENRKLDHIKICAEKDVSSHHNYWDDIVLLHETIPKVDMENIHLEVEFLGKKLNYPIIVDAMTGGHKVAKTINENIAKACEELGIGMAVGSQRGAIENPSLEDTYSIVAKYDLPLRLGNLGAPQFALGYGEREIEKAMEMIDAHALEIHFNYLQESVQPEGDTKVKGLEDKLRVLARKYPLIAKETGAGISRRAGEFFKEAGFRAIDVSGVSGTSFAAVEYHRGGRGGKVFWDWGLPAPYSLMVLRDLNLPLIGSGGIRNGLDAAKALALGANVVGIARVILKPAMKSYKDVVKKLEEIIEELRIAIFLSGASSVKELQNCSYVIRGELAQWLKH
ncbi:type 2 isopentenyl-diphosphate Delta-isomerase [Euryarchaeota archaeon ex4484_178]|nr:MAG: type 2 isopentenyl-diphosphate Delta-isomerase [Euryarchaeota archaeon ex4484_178]